MLDCLQMLGAQLFLADISKSSNRARHLGINHQAALAGSLLGPALGGWLAGGVAATAPALAFFDAAFEPLTQLASWRTCAFAPGWLSLSPATYSRVLQALCAIISPVCSP